MADLETESPAVLRLEAIPVTISDMASPVSMKGLKPAAFVKISINIIFTKTDADTQAAINSVPFFILRDNIPKSSPVIPKIREYIIAETGPEIM